MKRQRREKPKPVVLTCHLAVTDTEVGGDEQSEGRGSKSEPPVMAVRGTQQAEAKRTVRAKPRSQGSKDCQQEDQPLRQPTGEKTCAWLLGICGHL